MYSMTKKSSFLRQLNLYGFNRLSGSGPNQGSYCKLEHLIDLKDILCCCFLDLTIDYASHFELKKTMKSFCAD